MGMVGQLSDISYWVRRHAEGCGDKVALRCEERSITYAEFEDRVANLAAMLAGELGIEAGDRVAHLGANSPEMLDLLFACARIGAILAPLNWRLAAPELAWILNNCTPKAVLAEAEFLATLDTMRAELAEMHYLSYGEDAPAPWLGYAAALSAATGASVPSGGALEAPLMLVYTSGTTGHPKGTVLQQNALFYNALNVTAAQNLTADDVVLTALPMFHVGGMNIQTTPAIHAGATVVIQRRFEPGEFLALIARWRPSLSLVVPAVSQALIAHPDWQESDLSSLRLLGVGSSAVPHALVTPWQQRGVTIVQIYGLTESCPVAICTPIDAADGNPSSCGKPVLHCQARIVDDEGRDVAGGAAGEIWLKGPNMLRGYWNNPEATQAAFANGWFKTGDIGHRDDDGFFYIDDRKKDMVISGGENIYPAELENVLAECAAIAEATVVGQPDPRWVEVPVACIVRRGGVDLSAQEVLALFDGRLARFKHPRRVVFLDGPLPRTALGKVKKHEVRDLLAALGDA